MSLLQDLLSDAPRRLRQSASGLDHHDTASSQNPELAHLERLATVGQLAAGLTHELSQPLLAASSFLSVALARANGLRSIDPRALDALQSAQTQVQRAMEIIRSTNRFVARGEPQCERLDLAPVARGAVGFVRYELLRGGCLLSESLPMDLPQVFADRVQVQQVIVNLLRNAMDAVVGRGRESRKIAMEIRLESSTAVKLTVADSGPGIPVDQLDRVFTAYHTTKPEGLGLGLFISRMLVEANGGKLWADNLPCGGAVFSITLPVAQGARQP